MLLEFYQLGELRRNVTVEQIVLPCADGRGQ